MRAVNVVTPVILDSLDCGCVFKVSGSPRLVLMMRSSFVLHARSDHVPHRKPHQVPGGRR